MNRNESKYFNTAARMDEALISLLEKKDFEYITVKEVCAAAGVNRSTFYLHYETTRDLLEECTELMRKRFLAYFDVSSAAVIGKIRTCPLEELVLVTPKYLTPYLKYISENRRVYAAAITRPEAFDAVGAYGALFRHVFDPILERFRVPSDERAYMMRFYVGGISSMIAEWLKNGCADSIEKIMSVILCCIPSSEQFPPRTGDE